MYLNNNCYLCNEIKKLKLPNNINSNNYWYYSFVQNYFYVVNNNYVIVVICNITQCILL